MIRNSVATKKVCFVSGVRAKGAAALAVAAAAAALLMPTMARAGTDIWSGGANDGLWSSGGNWQATTTPITGDILSFGSTPGTTVLTDDLTLSFGALVFNATADAPGAAAAYTFNAGGAVTVLTVTGAITDHSANGNAQTFNLPVSGASFAFSGAGNSIVAFNNGATFSGALTSTSNATTADVLSVGAGSTVTFGAASTIGVAAGTANSTTSFSVTGATNSTLTINNTLNIGSTNNTGTGTSNTENVNLSGIGVFNMTNTAGSLNLATGNQTNATLTLANTANTINVGSINVGSFANTFSTGGTVFSAALHMGAGTNTIDASTILVGSGLNGTLDFAGSSGTATIQGLNGGTATNGANITIGRGRTVTTAGPTVTSILALAGHTANVDANIVTIGLEDNTSFNPGTNVASITFDTGTFNAQQLIIGEATQSHGKTTATFTLGTNSSSTGVLNVASAFYLYDQTLLTADGNAQVCSFVINGGTANIHAPIQNAPGGYTGTNSTSISFQGGTVNMFSNAIGASGTDTQGKSVTIATVTMPTSGHTATIMNLGTTGVGVGTADGINGAGLTMNGAGTLILDGTNTYGQTTVSNGVLQVGAGSNTGTLGTGAVTMNGGTLSFNRNDGAYVVSNAIGGNANGTVQQAGTGTTTLSGSNTYAGKTVVTAGTLALSTAGTNNIASSSSIAVSSGATLDVTQVTGGFALAGTQTLANNGTVAGSVSVPTGTTATGVGTYGALTNAGGNLRAGSTSADGSVGTMTVGNLTVSGGDFRVDLPSVGNSDLINVTGLANFTGASTITVIPGGANGVFTILSAGTLDAGQALSGGGSATGIAPTLSSSQFGRQTYTLSYTDTSIMLTVSGSAANLVWNNTAPATGDGVTWDTQVNQNWLNGSTADVFFAADNVTFNDNNNGHYAVTVAAAGVNPGVVTISNNNSPYVFTGGAIGGTASVVMNGSSTAVIANNNTYSGGTTISSGTIDVGNGTTAGTLGSGPVTNNGTLVLHRSDATVFANAIGGTGSLLIAGGNVTLSGTSSYTGTTTINNGITVGVTNSNAFGSVTGGSVTVGVDKNSTAAIDLGANTTANGITFSTKQFLIAGTGPNNTGVLQNSCTTNTQNNAFGNIKLMDDALVAGGRMDIGRNGANDVLDLNGHTLTLSMTGSQPLFGIIGQTTNTIHVTSGNIVVSTGQLDIETNAQLLDDGSSTITFNTGANLELFKTTGVDQTRAMIFNGNNVVGSGNGNVALLNSNMTIKGGITIEALPSTGPSLTANDPIQLNGVITESGGSFGITKLGASTATLTNINSYTGVTTINGGILSAWTLADGAMPSSVGPGSSDAANILIGSTSGTAFGELGYSGSTAASTNRKFTLTGAIGGIDASGSVAGATLTMSDTGSLTFSTSGTHTFVLSGANTGNNTYAGVIQDNGGATTLQKSGTGTWVISGMNTYTGNTSVQGGTLVLGGVGALPANANLVLAAAATLDVNGNNVSAAGMTGAGATSIVANNGSSDAKLTFNGGTSSFNGIFKDGATNKIGLEVASGSLTLTQEDTFSGGVVIDSGATLQVQRTTGGHTSLGAGSVTVNAGGTLVGANNGNNGDSFGYLAGFAPQVISVNGGTVTDLGTTSYRITLTDVHFANGGVLTSVSGNAGDANGQYSSLGGKFESDASATTAVISAGKISLQNGVATFTVAAGSVTGGATPGVDMAVSSLVANYNAVAGSIVKSGTGVMQLSGANTYTGGTTVSGGKLVAANVQALGTGAATVHTGAALQLQNGLAKAVVVPLLTFDGTASVDLTNDKLIVQDAVTHATSVASLQAAAHSVLTSSTMAANFGIAVIDNGALAVPFGTFGGQTVDGNSILVSPEVLGDANADGNVDAADLNTVLNNFGAPTLAWTSGNFDGAATVNLTDLAYVLNNFGVHNANASAMSGAGGVVQAAPEPTSLAMAGLGAAALLMRRRKA